MYAWIRGNRPVWPFVLTAAVCHKLHGIPDEDAPPSLPNAGSNGAIHIDIPLRFAAAKTVLLQHRVKELERYVGRVVCWDRNNFVLYLF
jgi:hypothetical protein